MKLFARFFLSTILLCLFGATAQTLAQYAQTTDEVSLLQTTSISNTPTSFVRGVSDSGKRVIFESTADIVGKNPDFNQEIFLYDGDKQVFIQITDTQHVYDPADASKAFADRKILQTVSNNSPALSGDGTRIAFSSSGIIIPGDAGKNDDGNQELYLAIVPLNSTTPIYQRITNTAASTAATKDVQVFDNYSPTLNFTGTLIGFLTNRTLTGMTNPDALVQIVLYNTNTAAFTQVTNKRETDAIDTFFVFKGFNINPQLSGNGNVLAFISGYDHAPTTSINNKDFNGEIFLYDVVAKTITQVTNTTGFAGYPATISTIGTLVPDRPMNIFNAGTKHLSNDGNLLVFESAGDLETGKNTDKTREVFLYNRTTAKFTQITANSPLPTSPTQTDIDKIDYDFGPGISPNGQYVFFASILNIVPVASGGTSSTSTDNADGSREIFRYDIAAAKFRQITYTPLSVRVLDQREPLLYANSNAAGTDVYFTDDVDLIGTNPDTSFEIFRAIIRPITETNAFVPAMVNAASFYTPDVTKPETNPNARGSIASIFGTRLANSEAVTTNSSLDLELNGVTVTVGGIAARIFYVRADQINFVIPDGAPLGDGIEFTVNNRGVVSKGKIKAQSAQPGIFTIARNGIGAGAVGCQVVTKDENSVVTGTTYPAPPCAISTTRTDSYLLLFGTGFKLADVSSVAVLAKTATDTDFKSYIPVYFGPQNFFPGLDQINLLLPTDFPTGTLKVKVTATSSGTTVESNEIEITVR